VEQQNFVYLQPREMPVLDMSLYFWNDVQRKVFERSQTSAVATGAFSSYINNQYQHDDASSRIYIATPSSQSLGLVSSQRDPRQEFRVQLGLNGLGTCTCGLFQDNLRPCAHAIAFIHQVYGAPLDYIAKFHTRAAWSSTYLCPLPPILSAALRSDELLLPPAMKKKRGRPQKKRMEEGRMGLRDEITEEAENQPNAEDQPDSQETATMAAGELKAPIKS
jgi:hypothetical protein